MRRPSVRRAVATVLQLLAAVVVLAPPVHRVGAQSALPQAAPPAIAVMYFTNGSIFQHDTFDPLSTGVTELLIHELAQNTGIRVVEREQLHKVMAELGLNATDRVDQSTAARIGHLVGAQHVVLGGFVVDARGRTMAITARAVHTETGVVVSSVKREGRPDDALRLIADLGRKLSTSVRFPPAPERPAPPGRGSEGQFDAVLLYSRALIAQDRGNVQQAAALFHEALARYPAYAQARDALVRLAALPRSE